MIPEKLMQAFWKQASHTAKRYTSLYTRHPDKSTILRFVKHYISEANIKIELAEDLIVGKKKQQNQFGSTKFCAISLDTPGKEAAKKWLEKNSKDLDTFAVQMVRDGWKASFSWDDYNDCFIASSTMREDGDKNYDTCVTSRSDNMWDAMLLNYYKIYILFKDQLLPTERPKDNWG